MASERAEHSKNWDDVYFYNPASSPGQNDQYEAALANDKQIQYFINHGDLVSANLVQFMDKDTLEDRTTIGDYRYSPFSAHSLTNWFPDSFNNAADLPLRQPDVQNPDTSVEKQDTAETRAANLS